MRAFLSHSSKDKNVVTEVAKLLGVQQCEIDEYTFEHVLNADAIRRALRRVDLFVFFLSENSIQSNFVAEELRQAQELTAKGAIYQVLIICLDDTSYKSLPAWLQDINISYYLKSAKHCARRIQAVLTEIFLRKEDFEKFYIGREDDHRTLRRNLTRPTGEMPRIVHAVGLHGVGRRTFLQRALKDNFPRACEVFIPVSVARYDGIDEIYRKLAQLHFPGGALALSEEFDRFAGMNAQEKLDQSWKVIKEMTCRGELLVFFDDGGVLDEEGTYNKFFENLHMRSSELQQISCAIVQSRLMPFRIQKTYPRTYIHRLSALSDEDVFDLISLKLKDLGISVHGAQISELRELCDGHPFNIDFIVGYVAQYGIGTTLSDPSDINEWRARRGLDFLRGIDFSDLELDVLRVIREYQYCNLEFISVALDLEPLQFSKEVRRLEEFCCIDRRGEFFVVSPPIVEAMRHDRRLQTDTDWYKLVAKRVLMTVSEYSEDESININLVTESIIPALKERAEIPFVAKFILPSHFLRIAREYYDSKDWGQAIKFCDDALKKKQLLTRDACVECLRIKGLSEARKNAFSPKVSAVVQQLKAYKTDSAKRIGFFIEGFAARKQKKYQVAEEKFRRAFELQETNIHVNRELAYLLCRAGRHSEAEPFARRALRIAPDNSYIIDVMIDCLEGKLAQGDKVDRVELVGLRERLKEICDGTDLHFDRVRRAREMFDKQDFDSAIVLLSDIIRINPTNAVARFYRAKCCIRNGNRKTAESDLEILKSVDASEAGMETFADEIEIELLIDSGEYHDARKLNELLIKGFPDVGCEIERKIKAAVLRDSDRAGARLVSWASG